MKKTFIAGGLIAAVSLQAQILPDFSKAKYQVKTGVESEYVVRGVQQADAVGLIAAEAKADNLYVGAQSVQPFETLNNEANETKLYVGILTPIEMTQIGESKWVIDTAYAYTFNPEDGKGDNLNRGNELKLGVFSDKCPLTGLAINPSFATYFNLDTKTVTFEAGLGHKWCLGCLLGVDELKGKLGLDVGARFGLVSSSDVGGGQIPLPQRNRDNDYGYYAAKADIVWRINDSYAARIGARVTGNNDGRSNLPQSNFAAGSGDREANVFWGASVSASF